jgi:hypothetical protein
MVPRAEPNTGAAAAVQRGAIGRGLIIELGGRGNCVVRLMPPLNVSRPTRSGQTADPGARKWSERLRALSLAPSLINSLAICVFD